MCVPHLMFVKDNSHTSNSYLPSIFRSSFISSFLRKEKQKPNKKHACVFSSQPTKTLENYKSQATMHCLHFVQSIMTKTIANDSFNDFFFLPFFLAGYDRNWNLDGKSSLVFPILSSSPLAIIQPWKDKKIIVSSIISVDNFTFFISIWLSSQWMFF